MNSKTRNIIGASATLLTAALLLNDCKEMPKNGEATGTKSEFEPETGKVRKRISSIFSENNWPGIGTINDEEFKVKVDIVDGELAEDFNAINAVRDCIESSGKYICADRPDENSTICYAAESTDGAMPLYIQEPMRFAYIVTPDRELLETEIESSNMIFSVGRSTSSYDFNKENVDETQAVLNTVCNDVINFKNEYVDINDFCGSDDSEDCEEFYERSLRFGGLAGELVDSSDELYSELRENGFDVSDLGGANFEIIMGDYTFGVNRDLMFIPDKDENSDEYETFAGYQINVKGEAIYTENSEDVVTAFQYLQELTGK